VQQKYSLGGTNGGCVPVT